MFNSSNRTKQHSNWMWTGCELDFVPKIKDVQLQKKASPRPIQSFMLHKRRFNQKPGLSHDETRSPPKTVHHHHPIHINLFSPPGSQEFQIWWIEPKSMIVEEFFETNWTKKQQDNIYIYIYIPEGMQFLQNSTIVLNKPFWFSSTWPVTQFHKKDWQDEHGPEVHETELMEPLGKAELHRIFFNHLDAQLNKINRFYKLKETEYIAQARRLERQLLALFEVQEALVARQSSLLSLQSSSKSTDIDSTSYCDDESFDGKFEYCMHARERRKLLEEENEEEEKLHSETWINIIKNWHQGYVQEWSQNVLQVLSTRFFCRSLEEHINLVPPRRIPGPPSELKDVLTTVHLIMESISWKILSLKTLSTTWNLRKRRRTTTPELIWKWYHTALKAIPSTLWHPWGTIIPGYKGWGKVYLKTRYAAVRIGRAGA